MGMHVGLKPALDCIKASPRPTSRGPQQIDVPFLIFHGDDDQIVPIDASARLTAQIVPGAELKVYPGGSHGLFATTVDRFNGDLLDFIKA